MQGSTPQEKLFESMKDPATRGGTRIERQYTTDVSPKSKDYQDYYSKKSGDYRPLTVGLNPLQEEGFNLMGGYGRGRAEDLAFDAEKAMQESLGGGTGFTGGQERAILEGQVPMGAGTPYQAMADAFRQQSERGLQDTLAAQRAGLVGVGQHGGSAVCNEIQARAIAENQQNINSQLAQMYGGAYKMAQDQRQPLANLMAQQQRAGMGAYPSIAGMPMDLYGQLAAGGAAHRGIGAEARAADIAAYTARGLQPGKALQDYVGNLGGLSTAATGIAGLLG